MSWEFDILMDPETSKEGMYTRKRMSITSTLPLGVTLLFVMLLLVFWIKSVSYDDTFPEITLPAYGTVKGRKNMTSNETFYYSFRGIPYAKPPVGELRFKAPVKPEPWEGVLEALNESSYCNQYSTLHRNFEGDEDCLYLDVFIPQLPGYGHLRPVMVYIHGGSTALGSENSMIYNPVHLLEAGVVYVSFNYRIGAFGFLSTQDSSIPGNAGMKDQVQALRWVQENIAAFGGDPKKVTIFGINSGGISVYGHMLSPMSKGLFQGAIAMSASITNPSLFETNSRDHAFKLARTLKLSVNTTEELADALRNVEAEKIMAVVYDHLYNTTERYNGDECRFPTTDFILSLESVVDGEEPFLLESPTRLLDEGKFHDVPFMTGLTSQEGVIYLLNFTFQTFEQMKEFDKNFGDHFKQNLRYCQTDSCGDSMMAKVRSFYFQDKPLGKEAIKNFIELCTDLFIAEGTLYAAKKISSLNTAPVYLYQFSYVGELNLISLTVGKYISGASHGDELPYLFEQPYRKIRKPIDLKMRARLINMWTNFCKTGNPTPESSDDIPAWLPYSSKSTNYLNIDSQVDLKRDLNKERMDFWRFLYSSFQS